MTRASIRWASVALFVACLWLVLRWAPAGAQDRSARLDLARICAGEAGLVDANEIGDCAAIVHVLQRRAERQGVPLTYMTRAYSGRHVGVEASPRPWVAGLRLDGRQPAEWPASASWARYRPAWLELVRHVDDVLEGAVLNPCPGADHWGGRMDDHRAERAGWTRIECDMPTRNRFWRVPRRAAEGAK